MDAHTGTAAVHHGGVVIKAVSECELLRFLYSPLAASVDPLTYFSDHSSNHLIIIVYYLLFIFVGEKWLEVLESGKMFGKVLALK